MNPKSSLLTSPSAALLLASWFKWVPIDFTEACGFVTGAVCVWLATRGSIWSWPVGLANSLFFAFFFWRCYRRYFRLAGAHGGSSLAKPV